MAQSSPKMKTLWFKVENGPADEVEVRNAENIKQLKQEIIQQHPRMFGEDQDAGVWHLYKSDEAEEPENSKSSISVLGNSGTVDGPEIVLRRVPTTAVEAANQNPLRMLQIEENKLQILKLEEMNNKLEEKSAKL